MISQSIYIKLKPWFTLYPLEILNELYFEKSLRRSSGLETPTMISLISTWSVIFYRMGNLSYTLFFPHVGIRGCWTRSWACFLGAEALAVFITTLTISLSLSDEYWVSLILLTLKMLNILKILQ